MSLLAQQVSFTSPSTTLGPQVIPLDAGIWNDEPGKVAIFWTAGLNSQFISVHNSLAVGIAISPANRATVATISLNAQGTSSADGRDDNTNCIVRLTTGGIVTEVANFVSFTANALTIDWSLNTAGVNIYYCMVLGGDDLSDVFLDQIQSPLAPGEVVYSGVGFPPTSMIGFTASDAIAPPNTPANSQIGVGFWAGSNSRGVSGFAEDAVLTSNTSRIQSDHFLSMLGNSLGDQCFVSATGDDGYTLNWEIADGTARYAWILCLRGPRSNVIVADQPATNIEVSRNAGFPPKAAMVHTGMATASLNVESDSRIGIGGFDATGNQAFAGALDQNGVPTTNADRIQDSTLGLVQVAQLPAATVVGNCSFSVNGNFLVENWSSVDGTQRESVYLVLGDAASGGGGDAAQMHPVLLRPLGDNE